MNGLRNIKTPSSSVGRLKVYQSPLNVNNKQTASQLLQQKMMSSTVGSNFVSYANNRIIPQRYRQHQEDLFTKTFSRMGATGSFSRNPLQESASSLGGGRVLNRTGGRGDSLLKIWPVYGVTKDAL